MNRLVTIFVGPELRARMIRVVGANWSATCRVAIEAEIRRAEREGRFRPRRSAADHKRTLKAEVPAKKSTPEDSKKHVDNAEHLTNEHMKISDAYAKALEHMSKTTGEEHSKARAVAAGLQKEERVSRRKAQVAVKKARAAVASS